jgi:hypothetical protein
VGVSLDRPARSGARQGRIKVLEKSVMVPFGFHNSWIGNFGACLLFFYGFSAQFCVTLRAAWTVLYKYKNN